MTVCRVVGWMSSSQLQEGKAEGRSNSCGQSARVGVGGYRYHYLILCRHTIQLNELTSTPSRVHKSKLAFFVPEIKEAIPASYVAEKLIHLKDNHAYC